MRKSILAHWAILIMVTMTLSGCLVIPWWGDEGGGGHDGGHEHGDRHEHGGHEHH